MRQSVRPISLLLLLLGSLIGLNIASGPVLAAPPPCADLVITQVTIRDDSSNSSIVTENDPARVRIRVLNQGSCESLTFTVQWKQGGFAPTGPSYNVDRLGPNQAEWVEFVYTFQDPGDYQTVATVDTDNSVDETNEANNIFIQDKEVRSDQPDLRFTAFSVDNQPLVQGQTATFNITVYNDGPAAAGPFVVQFKQSQLSPTGPSKQFGGLPAFGQTTFQFEFAFPQAGNYTTVVDVDTDRTVEESNEDNNKAILALEVREALPDLVFTRFTIEPVDPAPGFPQIPVEGLNARIRLDVRNRGNLQSGQAVVQWKSDKNAATGPSEQIRPLAPGETASVIFEYAFPRSGNFTTVADIDTGNDVVESNEQNNKEILDIVVQEAVIDLVLTDFKVVPGPGVITSIPPAGESPLPVQNRLSKGVITFENQGNFPAGDFIVRWKPTLLADEVTVQVNGLKYGESETVVFDWTYKNAGTFQTQAQVDATNRIQETNEFNNNRTMAVTIEPELPDLVIANFTINPGSPVQGLPATATIRILNRGNSPAGISRVEWKPKLFFSNPPNLSQQIKALDPGETTVVTFDQTYSPAGTFQSQATVDTPDMVEELNENNNTETMPVTVQVATRDLVITDIDIFQQDLGTRGEGPGDDYPRFCGERGDFSAAAIEPTYELAEDTPYVVCVTVQNRGNFPVGPFVVSFNPDTFGLLVPSADTLTQQVDNVGPGAEVDVFFHFAWPQNGEFRTLTKVDAFNVIDEDFENNNEEIVNVEVAAVGPDLAITELQVQLFGFFDGQPPSETGPITAPITDQRDSCELIGETPRLRGGGPLPPFDPNADAQVTEDQVIRVCIVVINRGDRPADQFIVEWNPDSFGLLTPSPATVSTQVEGLDDGDHVVVEFLYVYTEPDTYRSVAKVDAFSSVDELNEDNNLALRNVVVNADRADLTVQNVYFTPDFGEGETSCSNTPIGGPGVEPQLKQGERVRVCIVIRNQGSEESGEFQVSWNPDAFGLLVPSAGTLTAEVNNLFPFSTQTVEFDFTYEQNGAFRSIATVDAFDVVEESLENNNDYIQNVVVDVPDIDLSITSFTINPSSPVRGSAVEATITVRNNSNYPTNAFSVQWKATGDDGSGPFARIPGLLPFQSETVVLESSYFIAGPYTSVALVDVFDEIPETNENNNRSTRSVTVQKRVTTVQITFNRLEVVTAFTDGIDGNAEWVTLMFVVDPNDPEFYRDATDEDGDVENGDNIGLNQSFTITLEEAFPVVLATAAFEVDDFLGIPTDGKFVGATVDFWTLLDRWGEGTNQTESIEGPCSNGRCYDLVYTVSVLSEPPPFAGLSNAERMPIPALQIPNDIPLPFDIELPDGVELEPGGTFNPDLSEQIYLPSITR